MYCGNCGRVIPDGSVFCSFCGARVENNRSAYGSSQVYDRDREVREAVSAGQRALQSLYAAREELGRARTWGFIDLVGGGLISTLAKRSKVENAQRYITAAKADLKRFSDELDDVRDLQRLDIDVDEFLNFADWFFDGFLVDFMVQEKINRASAQVSDAISRVEAIMRRLN